MKLNSLYISYKAIFNITIRLFFRNIMVLDIDEFRPEKGGNPEKIKENQKRRFCDETMVDKVVELDNKWRGARFEVLFTFKTIIIFLT